MSEFVPGTIVLIGKLAFLAALYGFVMVVFRGLMAESRRGGRPSPATGRAEREIVTHWELRPGGAGVAAGPAATPLGPPPGPVVLTPPVVPPVPLPAVLAPEIAHPQEDTLPPIDVKLEGEPVVLQPPVAEPDVPIVLTPPEAQKTIPALFDAEPEPVDLEDLEGAALPVVVPEPEPVAEPEAEPEPEPEPEPVPVLVVLAAPEASLGQGQQIELGPVARLGRADDNDLVLKDRFVSSHHAEVRKEGDGYTLRDLGSTNGTFLNGLRVERQASLREGDRIGIGTSVFAFHEGREGHGG